ncbi:monoterpene synthase 8, chloroplastic-like [Musa acuminata AAA Group]|uniref:monoterpene synthase 8, chloroplastic-like n=1 Tax=Musa acuminata AAA Group TaxID=214697 RepID=UPI0031DAA873
MVSIWWTDIGLAKRLPFLVENYLWTVGWAFEPQFWSYREIQTKANCFVTMIDDVYEVYGTLDELELFTDAVDINAIDKFPEYMKMCLLAVFNTANDAAHRITKEKNLDILPYPKRAETYHRFLDHLTTSIT